MENIEKEIQKIKERNARVEIDKAREISVTRKVSIMILTYATIVIFFYAARLPKPRINAIVPTLGFGISTLSLSFFKRIRMKYHKG